MSDHATAGAMPTLKAAIAYYRAHGHFGPYAIRGGENDADPNPDPAKTTDAETFPDGLGDQGKAAIRAERDARKAAEKAAKDAATELETLRQEKAAAAAAKAAADEADAAKRGEFEALATKRKQEADEAKADAEAKGSKLTRAETLLKAVIADRVKEIEATGDKDLIAAFPRDAEPLDQIEWLDDPRTKAALKAASEDKKVNDATNRFKTPITPKADAAAQHKELQQRTATRFARNYTG